MTASLMCPRSALRSLSWAAPGDSRSMWAALHGCALCCPMPTMVSHAFIKGLM